MGARGPKPTPFRERVRRTLTRLAIAVDQAQADLDAAIAAHTDALEALRAALEAA